MKQIIIYDLKDKNNLERTRIIQNLYGHKNKSNYNYFYKRKGLLKKIKHKRERKTVLYFNNKESLEKASRILKELKIKFEIAVS